MERLFEPHTQKPILLASATIHQAAVSMLSALGLCLMLCSIQYVQAEGTGRIVKWKDEKGVTHYGDSIPMQYINRENSLINRQGVTVKHNKSAPTQDNTDELAKMEYAKSEQAKKDKALLGAFTNANEIDLALERNIQLDKIALENLQQEKANHQKNLDAKQVMAASFEKRKMVTPKELKADIVNEQAQLDSLNKEISARNNAIGATRKRFDEDKKRYLLLKSQPSKEAP
ncbi:DUF4124 domain-containing protein [Methylotenera sp. L2L1]|uniref:DUF4124 domain-containing protein n=1 Tax=Methylotenera sp. L2L1 TaxID=1502770 RepID=UPI0005633649|nr:DUF4124 domain-containing protein [Methylotenera sp. L2L1]